MCCVLPKGLPCRRRNSCLCSRRYFGQVGWAGRPTAFSAFSGAASRLRAEALRRASTQAGHPFVMLTYLSVRSASLQRSRTPRRGRPCCGLPFDRPQTRTGQLLWALSSGHSGIFDAAHDRLHEGSSPGTTRQRLSEIPLLWLGLTTRLRNSLSIAV